MASLCARRPLPALACIVFAAAATATPGVFDVRDYGAIGDGALHNNTRAIAAAVAAATSFYVASGRATPGVVLVTGGAYLSGRVALTDGCTLRVASDAALRASPDVTEYPGSEDAWAFLYARGAVDVAVDGGGVVDGGFINFAAGFNVDNDEFVPRGWPNCTGECRPRLAKFDSCTRVRVANVTLTGSPDWTLHFFNCTYVHVVDYTQVRNERGSQVGGGRGMRVRLGYTCVPPVPTLRTAARRRTLAQQRRS